MEKILNLWLIVFVVMTYSCTESQSIRLDELDLQAMEAGWGAPQSKASITEGKLSIGGIEFDNGIGTHAISSFLIDLGGNGKEFTAKVGVDDAASKKASVVFYVLGDKKILWESGTMKHGEAAKAVKLDISSVRKLGLLVGDAGDDISYDHANWVDASITYTRRTPKAVGEAKLTETEYILTPPAPDKPRINGAKIYGVRAASPFLYRIPATGKRPMTFTAHGLPIGLELDKNTGIISGRIANEGEYPIVLTAENAHGKNEREFKIIVGQTLALTPPMGWNSWYIHYHRVSDEIMREAADVMISSGMADYGYNYVNIDDCWMKKVGSDDPEIGGDIRDSNNKLLCNKRFPDMNSMTDYIHSKGLKAGTYISPGPTTCAGYTGSYKHEKLDAQTFADWGFDFLKYDWCSYGRVVNAQKREDYIKPYRLMWDELQALDRDMVVNLCQYGMSEVWEWGGDVGHSWRTTGDLGLQNRGSMPGYYNIGMSNARHHEYARPGAWNDPDYILIGWVGSAQKQGEGTKTKLLPSEQYSYMSMWSLMAAPLFFSGDMAKLDDFTLNILCNHEVINVNQDELGKQGIVIRNADNEMVMVKELVDGSKAVGLFHISGNAETPSDFFTWEPENNNNQKISFEASELGLEGKFSVRDLWRQIELGEFSDTFEVEVPYHGVALLKITPAK